MSGSRPRWSDMFDDDDLSGWLLAEIRDRYGSDRFDLSQDGGWYRARDLDAPERVLQARTIMGLADQIVPPGCPDPA